MTAETELVRVWFCRTDQVARVTSAGDELTCHKCNQPMTDIGWWESYLDFAT